jgi:hypothetical protein
MGIGVFILCVSGVGRVVGGSKVSMTGVFPWQLSLATGFLGFFYQHRLLIQSAKRAYLDCVLQPDGKKNYCVAKHYFHHS